MKYYLGLDQGTTGTTAILFDESFALVAKGYMELHQHYPAAGWVEHEAEEIYRSLLVSAAQAIKTAGITGSDIRAIGIANQGESIVLWDKETGKAIYPVIVWQDRRTTAKAKEIEQKHGDTVQKLTGLRPDAYFGATKIAWVLENVPEAKELLRQNRLLAGPTDAYMMWRLTGGKSFYTDAVTASRTSLMNVHTMQWDETLLSIFGVPKSILPEIRDNAADFGQTDPDSFLGITVPICGNIVDQQSALLGQGCVKSGEIKTTYGTGCFMLMNTGEQMILNDSGLLPTPALALNGKMTFALDGGAYIAGAAVQWLRDGLKIIDDPAQSSTFADSLTDNGGVYFVPAFAGLAAPYSDPYARGTIVGLTGGITSAHIARATLEATAYQVYDILDTLKAVTGRSITSMRADGGSTKSEFLMQFQADILGLPIEVPEINETTALGTVFLAALGIGDLKNVDEVCAFWKKKKEYLPRMTAEKRQELLYGWHKAVERSRGWLDPNHK